MYHRFDEQKYPSTNINMNIFKKHMEMIKNSNITFLNPIDLKVEINKANKNKLILLTIDDGYTSFYKNAWPYLKSKKIPFILFISTREVGKNGYMNWDQIREIDKSNIGVIGNHSHSHEYLIDLNNKEIEDDINKSIKIFQKELGYNPDYFSYPFGEFSLNFINIIKKNFNFGFGQHSGVIDLSKDKFQLPRFPINEKYGDLKRFKSLINLIPFYYKNIIPYEKYLYSENNPPKILVEFFPNQKNLQNITCYSNEGNKWRKSEISFENEYKLKISINEKFTTERGRINCSLNDNEGWRWFGIQFVIKEY
tara:strand:+ start:541 stop:1467 length:927 start_codon:yes stop_codon:yes gene_type:complete